MFAVAATLPGFEQATQALLAGYRKRFDAEVEALAGRHADTQASP
jgi:hypothetical protein